jgi:iron complex transport system substrate-binding protein
VRVVSLLPAATEIVAALGRSDWLVGVSHECDYPPEVRNKPRVTRCEIYGKGLSSAQVDAWVNAESTAGRPLYTLDAQMLRDLEPDVIVTQQLCDVCAIDYGSVAAFAASLPKRPKLLNLSPSSVAEIFGDIERVAAALGQSDRGQALVASLTQRVDQVRSRVAGAATRPRCCHLEWIDPLFCSGHWTPELVEIAGGIDPLGRKGLPSIGISWEQLLEAQPEILVLACCGYDAKRTMQDIEILKRQSRWDTLPAVSQDRIYAVNGSAHFSRPGPRIVDSLEILAQIIHPELFANQTWPALAAKYVVGDSLRIQDYSRRSNAVRGSL